MNEMASIHTKNAIDMLLSVHALTNMHRGSGNSEYAKTALAWFDKIETEIRSARRDIETSKEQ